MTPEQFEELKVKILSTLSGKVKKDMEKWIEEVRQLYRFDTNETKTSERTARLGA
jgi:hypothetical protein